MVASAFPLAQVALNGHDLAGEGEAAATRKASKDVPTVADLPFIVPSDGFQNPPTDGATTPAGPGGASSRLAPASASPVRADASSSVLLSQVQGAAKMLGHDVAVPPLPVDKIAAENPLRAALLTWIAASNSVVPPEDLVRELARADAMPLDLQREIALLILSTIEATALQTAALAKLTPDELAWIYANPQLAEELASGVQSPQTRALAVLAAKVDMAKSIEATLLLLHAVEATRPTFEENSARQALLDLPAEIDETTKAMIALILGAQTVTSDAEKVRLAAKLVALGAGLELPPSAPAPTFPQALDALLAATQQAPSPLALKESLARAAALPDDLERAVARLIAAQANAVRAASPEGLTPTSQPEALVALLVAVADTLPTLEKYSLFWTAAPASLRAGEWEPGARIGWAAHHAGLAATSARSTSVADLVRANVLTNGRALPALPVIPTRSFVDAYAEVADLQQVTFNASMRAAVADAMGALDPAVRDAATVLLNGALESARLQRLAYAALTPEEAYELRVLSVGIDALYAKPDASDEDVARLARAFSLAQRVDRHALDQSILAAAIAADSARAILEGKGAIKAQGAASVLEGGFFAFLKRLVPIGSAQAQTQLQCLRIFIVESGCGNDVILRIRQPFPAFPFIGGGSVFVGDPKDLGSGQIPLGIGFGGGAGPTCNERDCVFDFSTNTELLVITGSASTRHEPLESGRVICRSAREGSGPYFPVEPCRFESVPEYGAPMISLDLGGDDLYVGPVAMVSLNSTIPVSIHIDAGGNDTYADPTSLYDAYTPLLRYLGDANGHPTSGAAPFGGFALSLDLSGRDNYGAPTRSQGYGRLGLGALVDLNSDPDLYRADVLSQGAASDTFTLGGGILLDQGGTDTYEAETGQGYGIGSLFIDAGGRDIYRNGHPALGAPFVNLDIIPGGDLTTLDERGNDRTWLDGPGTLSAGVGVDIEILLLNGDTDRDFYPDVVEFLVGTNPHDPQESPETNPGKRAQALLHDTDKDGHPDYIERALSTDPNDAKSYPAGFPSGPGIIVPAPVYEIIDQQELERTLGMDSPVLNPFNLLRPEDTGVEGFRGHDKIVDLRLPLQDAGSIDVACTGQFYANSTIPIGFLVQQSIFEGVTNSPTSPLGTRDTETNAPKRDDKGQPIERCVYVAYSTRAPGKGSATVPSPDANDPRLEKRSEQSFDLPVGILAIGDVVDTLYADDYFVIIDLGGRDRFNGSAGGALPVATRPVPRAGQPVDERDRIAFLAPSLVVNVDLTPANATLSTTNGTDHYVNATRTLAHGAAFGVLVDTHGDDHYVAGHASQGSLGGVLLDLAGTDTYSAGQLSQGAGLASTAGSPQRGFPQEGSVGNDHLNIPGSPFDVLGPHGAYRRALPGILLDMGDHGTQQFTAADHSQGFARGFASRDPASSATSQPRNATNTYGILVSLGEGPDEYEATLHAQGVGGGGGTGLLLDRAGRDTYAARAPSHGATISQVIGTQDAQSRRPQPAAGLLLDLRDLDAYLDAGSPREGRQNTVTLARAETAYRTATDMVPRTYLDVGLHVDAELRSEDPEAFVASLGGAGTSLDSDDFQVHLPTARLAIGKAGLTRYTREYAFVVDLGGTNYYNYSAAGALRDQLAQRPSGGSATTNTALAANAATVSLFPVSFLLDAGGTTDTSYYRAPTGVSQGAGFFSVGVLADLGGFDNFSVTPKRLESAASSWLAGERRPTIDGTIGTDWDGIPAKEITLTSIRDPSFSSPWTMRVANNNRTLFLALEGRTMSDREEERKADRLTIDFDMGHRQQRWDTVAGRTGIDEVRFDFDDTTGACVARDWGMSRDASEERSTNLTVDGWWQDDVWGRSQETLDEVKPFEASCRYTEDGRVYFELAKSLIETSPADPLDLGFCYVDDVGFGYNTKPNCVFPADKLGVLLEFRDAGAGYNASTSDLIEGAKFTWPPGATRDDNESGYLNDGSLVDEMRQWGVLTLADRKDATPAIVERTPVLTQGAAIAGVGVLAMLGNGLAGAELTAGDRSQGYAGYTGLALVFDAGGSDLYQAGEHVQAASENAGVAFFVDAEGNDNYLALGKAQGWTPAAGNNAPLGATSGISIFLDLGGNDEYAWEFTNKSANVDQLRGRASGEEGASPNMGAARGNDLAWVQNTTGLGADYRFLSAVREALAGQLIQQLHGRTSTKLSVTKYDPARAATDRYANGCTTEPVSMNGPHDVIADTVCFVATIETGNGTLASGTRSPFAQLEALGGSNIAAAMSLLRQGTDGTAGGRVDVKTVDFMIDRHRVATALAPSQIINKSLTRWSAPVNVSDLDDGYVNVKALATFMSDVEGIGVVAFADDGTYPIVPRVDTPSIRKVMINNLPGIDVALAPAYSGRANATFSPVGFGTEQALYVNYSVSHDAAEDHLEAANGWEIPRWRQNLPCKSYPPAGQPPELCNIISLYLPQDQTLPLDTRPGPSSVNTPDKLVVEQIGVKSYERQTAALGAPLRITLTESFHLALPTRLALYGQAGLPYNTFVKIILMGPDGKVVPVGGEGTPEWILGGGVFTHRPTGVTTSDINQLTGGLADPAVQAVEGALGLAADTARDLTGNPVWNVVEDQYRTCPANSGGGTDRCSILFNDVGVPAPSGPTIRPCAKTPPSTLVSAPFQYPVWYAVRLYDTGNPGPFQVTSSVGHNPGPVSGVPVANQRICRDLSADLFGAASLTNSVNSTTNQLGPVADIIEGLRGSGNQDPGATERRDGLNFTDIWFDVNAQLPQSAEDRGIRFEGDSIVIPSGYRLQLKFGLVLGSEEEEGVNLGAAAGGAILTAGREVDRADLLPANSACPVDPVTLGLPPASRFPCTLLGGTVNEPTIVGVFDIVGGGIANNDQLKTGSLLGVPASVFFVESGPHAPDEDQSRLEIRTPAPGTTSVSIGLRDPLTGDFVNELRGALLQPGDLEGTPTQELKDPPRDDEDPAYWTDRGYYPRLIRTINPDKPTRWTNYNFSTLDPAVQDGLYHVRITAHDSAGESTRSDTLLVDRTPPQVDVTTHTYLGKSSLVGASGLRATWSVLETGSGIDQVYLFHRAGDEGDLSDISTWKEHGPFPASVRSFVVDKGGNSTHYLMAIGVDRAKNVEGTFNQPDLRAAINASFAQKAGAVGAQYGARKIIVDVEDPRVVQLPTITGGRALDFEGSPFTFLRSAQKVVFAICVADDQTGIGLVKLKLQHQDAVTGVRSNVSYTMKESGPCGTPANRGNLFVNDTWHLANTDQKRFPEGGWAAEISLFDRASNLVSIPVGNLILDHKAPTVNVLPPVLPAGQTAVKPGDLVKIRLLATDTFGVEEALIRVDASAFATGASELRTRAVRVDGLFYQEASFTVDRPGLANASYEVVVRVPDLAGNVTEKRVSIAVNVRDFDFVPGSLRVTNVTHNSLVLRWNTTENTSAQVVFGTTPVALSGRTTLDANATREHAVLVEGLAPSTRYHLRAIAASTGGLKKESAILEAETKSALFLEPISPRANTSVSGLVKVAFRGGLLDSTNFVSFTLEVRDGPQKPWTFVTTATRQGQTHELVWNSSRFLDGTAYELRLSAEAGRDKANVVLGPLTSDNTPPLVTILSPLLATNDTTPDIIAEASDALSGLVSQPAALYIDGVRAPGDVRVESLPGGRVRLTYNDSTPLAQGSRALEMRVEDKAGNVAREAWRLAIDNKAPEIVVNPVRYAPGTGAAKAGGTVTFNLTLNDLSGIAFAAANTSGLSTIQPETRLVKIVNTPTWQGTVPVTAGNASQVVDVAIRAVDLAGNTGEIVVKVPVDNVPPKLNATSLAFIQHTRVGIDLSADEAILVNGTATAPLSPPVTAATTNAESKPQLVFAGLLPSRTYAFQLTAVDLAGNEVPLAGSFATQKDVLPPSAVGPLSVLDLLNGTLRFSWAEAKDDVGVSHYRVYRSDDGVTFRAVAEVTSPTYDDAGLPYEKPHVYKVAAVDHGANEGEPSGSLRAAATAPPSLSAGAVSPTVGTVTTPFRYAVTYTSPGGVSPAYVRVILDGVPQNMTFLSGDAKTGAVYVYETRLAPHKRDDPHTYTFEAFDGRYTARFPDETTLLRGPLVSGDVLAGGDVGGFASFAQRVPLSGVAGAAMALVLAVGVAAFIGRRKEGSR